MQRTKPRRGFCQQQTAREDVERINVPHGEMESDDYRHKIGRKQKGASSAVQGKEKTRNGPIVVYNFMYGR